MGFLYLVRNLELKRNALIFDFLQQFLSYVLSLKKIAQGLKAINELDLKYEVLGL